MTVRATAEGDAWRVEAGEARLVARLEMPGAAGMGLTIGGMRRQLTVLEHEAEIAVFIDGESWRLVEIDPLGPPAGADVEAGRLTAPMPGRVVQLAVAPGDAVHRGQPLMVIEAMKMEHTIAAPRDGVVETVRFAAGDLVEEGAELIALAAPAG